MSAGETQALRVLHAAESHLTNPAAITLPTARGLSLVRTEVQLLAEARAAWRAKLAAECNLARLRGYRRLTPAMKTDEAKAARALREADATLARCLGGGL